MKICRLLVLFFFVTVDLGASAGESPQEIRNGPYLFCNVFTSSACFGIAQGDKLNMEIVTDFVLYHISFSFGRSATIYSGFNPNMSASHGKNFEKCVGHNDFAECKRRNLDDGGIEFLARKDKDSQFLHVVISAGADGISLADSFLQNVRACSRSSGVISCTP
jgi:hypothetical protein